MLFVLSDSRYLAQLIFYIIMDVFHKFFRLFTALISLGILIIRKLMDDFFELIPVYVLLVFQQEYKEIFWSDKFNIENSWYSKGHLAFKNYKKLSSNIPYIFLNYFSLTIFKDLLSHLIFLALHYLAATY